MRGTIAEKIWANAPETGFADRRNLEWSRYNWRPALAWRNLERGQELAAARRDHVWERNFRAIYNIGADNKIKEPKAGKKRSPPPKAAPADAADGGADLKWLDDKSFKNPSEEAVDKKSQDTAGRVPEKKGTTQADKKPKARKAFNPRVEFDNELFTQDEIKKLCQLPKKMRDKILGVRDASPEQAEEINKIAKNENKENEKKKERRARTPKKSKDHGVIEDKRMVKYWDGYTHKYSPVRLKINPDDPDYGNYQDYYKPADDPYYRLMALAEM